MVPYVVSAVVAVTVMHILWFVLRECEGASLTEMLVWGPGMCGCSEYMGGSRGSCVCQVHVTCLR